MTGAPDANNRDESLLVHAYVDGELDPANAIAIEQRIAADPALAAERQRIEALRRVLRDELPRESAPPGLQLRVSRAIGLERERTRPTWLAMAASIMLAVLASSSGTWLAMRAPPAQQDLSSDALIASHLRALMAPQPVDVESSDQHTVKPWFDGKIPQSPRVVDLAQDGFPLVGGRIDVIGRTPVPTLVYRRHQHIISLTATPPTVRETAATPHSVQGYNLLSWAGDGVTYWAISDLNTAELETFARLFRDAPNQ